MHLNNPRNHLLSALIPRPFYGSQLSDLEEKKPLLPSPESSEKSDPSIEELLVTLSELQRKQFIIDREGSISVDICPQEKLPTLYQIPLDEVVDTWSEIFAPRNEQLHEIVEQIEEVLELLYDIVKDLHALTSVVPSLYLFWPLSHTKEILKFAAHTIWKKKDHPAYQDLLFLIKKGNIFDALYLVRGILASIHTQGKAYESALPPNIRPYTGSHLALETKRIQHLPNTRQHYASQRLLNIMSRRIHVPHEIAPPLDELENKTLATLSVITESLSDSTLFYDLKNRYDYRRYSSFFEEPREKTEGYHAMIHHWGTNCPEVRVVQKGRNKGSGAFKHCHLAFSHNDPTERSVILEAHEGGRSTNEWEGFLMQNLAKKGVPFLPHVLAIDRGSLVQKEFMCSLENLMCSRKQPLNSENFAYIAYCVSACLEKMYQEGWIHCDVKPDNILLNLEHSSGKISEVAVTDLGLAENLSKLPKKKRTTAIITPPEMLRGEISAATDVYGLGVTLWRIISCDLPGWEQFKASDEPPSFSVEERLDEFDAAILRYAPELMKELKDFRKVKFPEGTKCYNPNIKQYTYWLSRRLPGGNFPMEAIGKACQEIQNRETSKPYYRYIEWRNNLSPTMLFWYFCKDLEVRVSQSPLSLVQEGLSPLEQIKRFFSHVEAPEPWPAYLEIVFRCLHPDPTLRPQMEEIVKMFTPLL